MVGPIGAKRTIRLRALLREAYGDFCHWCARRMIFESAFRGHDLYATIEHLIERRAGGTNDWENLRLAHRKCNTDRSSKPPDPNSKRTAKRLAYLERKDQWRKGKIPGGHTQSRQGDDIDETGVG